jgi:DNA-binding transcriptional regulator LsrR (DeoR family)
VEVPGRLRMTEKERLVARERASRFSPALDGDAAALRSAAYTAARLYYLQQLSQAEVAERLGVSRSTVSRLLAKARDLQIVRIEVRPPASADALADALAGTLGLRRAMVIPAGPGVALAALADLAARVLASVDLAPGSVVALGWGRTMAQVVAALPPLPDVAIVPTIGGLAEQDASFQLNELVRRAAVASGGHAHFLHAPAMPSPALRRSLEGDPAIREVLACWDRISVALVGIGAPPSSVQRAWTHLPGSRGVLVDAVGDISWRYFDLAGEPVHYPEEQRLLGVSREQLAAAGTLLAVAAGVDKAPSILGACRTRLVDVLVTDSTTAEAVLALAERPGDAATGQ